MAFTIFVTATAAATVIIISRLKTQVSIAASDKCHWPLFLVTALATVVSVAAEARDLHLQLQLNVADMFHNNTPVTATVNSNLQLNSESYTCSCS